MKKTNPCLFTWLLVGFAAGTFSSPAQASLFGDTNSKLLKSARTEQAVKDQVKKDQVVRKTELKKTAPRLARANPAKKSRLPRGTRFSLECSVQVPVFLKDEYGSLYHQDPLISKDLEVTFAPGDEPFRKCVAGSRSHLSASVCVDVNPSDLAKVGSVELSLTDKLNSANSLTKSVPLNDNKEFQFPLVPVGPEGNAKVASFSIGSGCTFSPARAETDLFMSEAEQFGGQAGTLAKDVQPIDEVHDSAVTGSFDEDFTANSDE